MKSVFLALLLILSSNASASEGFPSPEKMNKVTVLKVKEIVSSKALVSGRFSISTIKLNNIYKIDTDKKCTYLATVVWSEFGWPDIVDVRVKFESCLNSSG